MGDRTHTAIEFKGQISVEQAEELLSALKDQGCEPNDCGERGDLSIADLTEGSGFYDSECNYAQMEDIEGWCRDNNVSYLKTWEAGGGFGPGLELFDVATQTTEQCSSIESSPAVELGQLIKARDEGTLDELVARLSKFTGFPCELEVFELADWPDELAVFMAKRALDVT